MKEEIKYDRTKLSKENFTVIDWFVYYTAAPAIIGVLLMAFLAVWIDYTPLLYKILGSLILIGAFGLTWYRAVWVDIEHKGKDTLYNEDYSMVIPDNRKYIDIFNEWMTEDKSLISKGEMELAEDFCTYLDNMNEDDFVL